MVKMKRLAALLALCLLLTMIPGATMEDLTIDSNGETAIPLVIDDEAENDALEIPSEIGAPEGDGQALEPEGIDLSGLDLALEGSVEVNEALTPNTDVGETLVHIVKPADGDTVSTGNLEIWLTWTFPGGTAREIAAKLLPTTVQLIRNGTVIAEQSITPGTVVFTAEGAHYLDVTLSEPGTYIIRARTPGGSGYSQVKIEAVGAEITQTPKPTATAKPTPEPEVTVDENGFGVDQTGVLRQYLGDNKKIVIPESVKKVGERVFADQDIQSVTFHSGVTDILESAFENCTSMTSVKLAKGLESIGEGAFFNTGLKTLDIPNTVTTIGTGAFHQSHALTSVSIPASVKSMGTYMFGFSENLKTVTFAEDCRVDTLDKDMFYSCTALENVTIPDAVKTLGQYAFAECKSLKSLRLPDNLETIMCYAFQNCSSLKELAIPASVTTIGTDVFDGCPNLTLTVVEGSYAEQYVKELGSIPYKVISKPTPTPTPAPKVSLSKCKATVKNQVYTGKALKPAITVKYGTKALKEGTDYTVAYDNNKAVGTATATLTGKGGYTGTKKVGFKILPPRVTLTGLKTGTKSFTATWKKGKAATGYQLQYALKKSFSGAKSVRVKGVKTTSKTVKSLITGKTYYARVRAYKTVGKQTYYSAWSDAWKVKVK